MADMTSIETALRKRFAMKPKVKEVREEFLKRLVKEAQGLDDEAFETTLPEAAQLWVNDAVEALNAGKPIPEFKADKPKDEDEAEEEEETEEETETETEEEVEEDEAEEEPKPKADKKVKPAAVKSAAKEDKVATTKKKAKVEKEVKPAKEAKAAKPAKEAKAAKADKPEKRPRGGPLDKAGVKYRIKKALLKNPSLSPEQLMTNLAANGGAPSKMTVAGIRAEFRHSLKVIQQEGIDILKLTV